MAEKTVYITIAGYRRLKEELDHLWRVKRPRVTQEVSDAAALGDRSENAEYIYGKRRLREIDHRLRYLSQRLDAVTVWQRSEAREDRAYFGAWVTLEDEEGALHRYRLVGPDEFDVKQGLISVDSPAARAVLGRQVGDEVVVRRPKGQTTYTLIEISYDEGEAAAGR